MCAAWSALPEVLVASSASSSSSVGTGLGHQRSPGGVGIEVGATTASIAGAVVGEGASFLLRAAIVP